jgi:hypothetical protein
VQVEQDRQAQALRVETLHFQQSHQLAAVLLVHLLTETQAVQVQVAVEQ